MVEDGDGASRAGPSGASEHIQKMSHKSATYHTHALPCGNESRHADEEADEGENTPTSPSTAEGDEDRSNEAADDATDAKATSKDNSRPVAVANGPSDEVGMSLAPQGVLDGGQHVAESGGVCGVLQGMEKSSPLLGRQIQLARTVLGDIDADDSRNLFPIRLDGNLQSISIALINDELCTYKASTSDRHRQKRTRPSSHGSHCRDIKCCRR